MTYFTHLFQTVINEDFENIFFLYHLAPGKRTCDNSYSTYRRVIESPRDGLQRVLSTTDAAHTFMTPPIFLFLGCLLTYLITSSVDPWENGPKTTCTKIFTRLWYLVKIPGQLDFRCALFGNWVDVVISAVMGQYAFLVLYFSTQFIYSFFWIKNVFKYFFNFHSFFICFNFYGMNKIYFFKHFSQETSYLIFSKSFYLQQQF